MKTVGSSQIHENSVCIEVISQLDETEIIVIFFMEINIMLKKKFVSCFDNHHSQL